MQTILVQQSEKSWTMQALHLACALARNQSARLVLLHLVDVPHPSYLGTSFGALPLTGQELDELQAYEATAAEYGVDLTIQPMQCVSRLNAVADAAEQLDAGVVFARIPKIWLPYWQELQTWSLNRRFSAAHRQLFTLQNGPTEAASITLRAARIPAGK